MSCCIPAFNSCNSCHSCNSCYLFVISFCKFTSVSTPIIAHFDLDSFFVSVEILNDPSLKGKPAIVGGSDRGVVAACSYEARKFGIHSGMPSSKAKKLCPQAIFLKGHRADYSKYSRWVTQIIAAKAPLFEKGIHR